MVRSEPVLRVSNVSHSYGAIVVAQQIDITIRNGDVHCLLGPSGSGKSTLLRLVAGLETLQEGRIELAGVEVANSRRQVSPEQRSIGFVFQDYALFPHLNVRRNVLFGMSGDSQSMVEAEALLDRVGMISFADAMPHTLSGGQQQRVALARALARHPKVMLLDEPFSGLDARLREDVSRTTLEILRAAGVATLMVTHDPREAMTVADRVSVIRTGRILQTGSPAEVYGQSVSRDVAEVFGPVNQLNGRVRQGRIAVPWGEIPAPGLAEGVEADVLVRPESLQIEPAAASINGDATITAVVLEGALARVTLRFADRLDFQVRDLARHGWAVGRSVHVSLAEDAAMIHPRPQQALPST